MRDTEKSEVHIPYLGNRSESYSILLVLLPRMLLLLGVATSMCRISSAALALHTASPGAVTSYARSRECLHIFLNYTGVTFTNTEIPVPDHMIIASTGDLVAL